MVLCFLRVPFDVASLPMNMENSLNVRSFHILQLLTIAKLVLSVNYLWVWASPQAVTCASSLFKVLRPSY